VIKKRLSDFLQPCLYAEADKAEAETDNFLVKPWLICQYVTEPRLKFTAGMRVLIFQLPLSGKIFNDLLVESGINILL
jgi:hypothetical protein